MLYNRIDWPTGNATTMTAERKNLKSHSIPPTVSHLIDRQSVLSQGAP